MLTRLPAAGAGATLPQRLSAEFADRAERGLARVRLADWALVRDVALAFLATRAMLVIVGVMAEFLLPRRQFRFMWEASPNALINIWSSWDAYHYVGIASEGYSYAPRTESNVAFFPLYPMLLRLGGLLSGRRDWEGLAAVGVLVSNLALVAAVVGLALLVRLDFDRATAARTVLYLLAFPGSLFLSAVYADSVFLALTVGAFYCARSERWWIAGVLAAGAALTRPQGVLLVVPLLIEYLAQRGPTRRALRPEVLALGLAPAALLAYFLYLGSRFGNPLVAMEVQVRWGRALTVPWEAFLEYLTAPVVAHAGGGSRSLVDLAFTVLLLALAVVSWRLLRPSYAAFCTVTLLALFASGSLMSMVRFGVSLFPLFIVLAIAGRRRWFDRTYLVTSTGLAGLFMALFAQWYWVG